LHILALFLAKARADGWYGIAPLSKLERLSKAGSVMSRYKAFETLREHKAQLHDSVRLSCGVELAAWSNCDDRITQESAEHHTLSLYVADGYECYQKVPGGWRNGGGPDRFCIMPRQYESTWDVRSDLSFVHLYCTDKHLRQVAEQIWDRSPASINLVPNAFAEDPQITLLYRQFLLSCNWQERANQLSLSSATTLLMTCLVQRYSELQWTLPQVRGGLAPAVAKRVKEYIEQHLDLPLVLADLAAQAGLSEFHFARMFKHDTGLAPHQFVMRARLQQAEQLLCHSQLPLTQIALECGFSSASHFSNRFKVAYGCSPTQRRQGR
jgi:AraC family transcriptional regulator